MGYIKFRLVRQSDASGNTQHVRVGRVESDMPSLSTLQTEMIWNSLSLSSSVRMWLELDKGILERDMLGGSGWLALDQDMLDVDKLV